MKKYVRPFIFSLLLWVSLFSWGFAGGFDNSSSTDFMQKVFTPSISDGRVIGWEDVGTTKEHVGRFLLRDGTQRKIDIGKWGVSSEFKTKPSFIVKFTQFLLRFTVVLSVTMVIFNGILYIIKTQKGEHSKEVTTNLMLVVVWLLLALASVIVIRLMNSVATTIIQETWTSTIQIWW